MWEQLNTQNLRNAIVSQTRKIIGLDVPPKCVPNQSSWKNNFSLEVYRADVASDGTFSRHVIIASTPIYDTLADRRFNELNIIQRSLTKMVWYNYAINYIPFIFVVLVPKREVSFETLVMPFDTWTWRLNAAMIIGVVAALTGFNSGRGDGYFKILFTLWNQLFRTISTILGQSDMSLGKFSKNGRVLIFAGFWYSTIFLLGNFYQGALYSCLTSIGVPNVPKELPDVLNQTNFDVVTMSQVTTNFESFNNISTLQSTLSAAIIPDLLRATNSPSTTNFLETLDQRTKFLTGNIFEIGSNISRNVGVNSGNGTSVFPKLPLIILDRAYQLNTLTESLSISADPIVLRNHAMTPFVSLVPWHGRRNFLYPMFSEELGRLVQSGIYDQWRKYKNADMQRYSAKFALTRKDFMTFSARKMSKSDKEINFAEANSVSFKPMKYAFALCVSLLVIAMISIVVECVIAKMTCLG
ncbi:hypothetical protein Fcan01_11351 [Folsomia candida]|uniref:Ionotropic glutamate receptor C-terminal domain-containing protein n=1 Tax=Folsomia candida TaxID=158441 RepID=A0A226EA17_FOLCA|nr:hypothetical protein Fcan01_11351 [Folsomia candida]